MDKKYWVPSLDKAHHILELIAAEPYALRLIDISQRLSIHKSSMFSLLHTMEELRWVERDKGDTYGLGSFLAPLGSVYFRQFDLVSQFHHEASNVKERIGETLQLAKLEGNQVLYLAKEEAVSPVKLTSEPGMKLPAHATGLGLSLLSTLSNSDLLLLYPEEQLQTMTPNTISTRTELLSRLLSIQQDGYALDLQEAVIGFSCVAAPIRGASGEAIGAVSCSMPQHHWADKLELAQEEICKLAQRLSLY
ncbi:MAG: IclR family transcriptional regulator [Paenibacillaceae bacterium]